MLEHKNHPEKCKLVSIAVLSFLHSTISTKSVEHTTETLPKSAKRKKRGVYVSEKKADGKVRDFAIFSLLVAKETNQRCHLSRLQVTGDVATGNGLQEDKAADGGIDFALPFELK